MKNLAAQIVVALAGLLVWAAGSTGQEPAAKPAQLTADAGTPPMVDLANDALNADVRLEAKITLNLRIRVCRTGPEGWPCHVLMAR